VVEIRDDKLRVQMRRYELRPSRTPLAYVWVELGQIEAIEVFRDRQDIPEEWQMDAGRCTFVQVWTYKAW
jgi:hypothetical protein